MTLTNDTPTDPGEHVRETFEGREHLLERLANQDLNLSDDAERILDILEDTTKDEGEGGQS